MSMHQFFRMVPVLLALLIAACGGAGDGSTSSVPSGDLTQLTNNRNATPRVNSWAPASVVDANGVAFVAWLDNFSLGTVYDNGKTIKVRKNSSGSSWDSAVVLAESVAGNYLNPPQIGVDRSGNVIVVWAYQEGINNRSIHAKRYTPAGGWETTATILRSGVTSTISREPKLAVAGNGDAMVVWKESDGLKSKLYTVAGGWAATVVPVDSSPTVYYWDLAADGNGNFMFLWSAGSGVQARYYAAGGSGWGGATTLHAEAGDTQEIQIQFDGNGNALAMWHHDGDATAARGWEIVVNRYVAGSGWSTATRYSALNAGSHTFASLHMAVDATGAALVMWDHYDGVTYAIQGNRYIPGTGWGTTTELASDAYAITGSIAVDAQGNGRTTWVAGEPMVSGDIGSAFCLSYDLAGSRTFMVSRSYSIASGWSAGTEQRSDNECLYVVGGALHPISANIASNAAGNMVGVLEGTSFYRDLLAYRYH